MHRLLTILLVIGAVAGFSSAAHHGYRERHDAFERHVADLCTDAALRAAHKVEAGRP
jgi:hypothetical protein